MARGDVLSQGITARQEPVKKADRKVGPPGDVLLVTITMNIAYEQWARPVVPD